MISSLWSRAWLGALFLIGLLLAPACRFGNEPASAPDKTVTEVSREERGLTLIFETGSAVPPAKVSVYFKIRDASNKPITALDSCGYFTLSEDNETTSQNESAHSVRPAPEKFKMYTLLLLDLSGSIVKTSLDTLKAAASRFVESLFGGSFTRAYNVELGIFYFDGRSGIFPLIDFTADTAKLLYRIKTISDDLVKDFSTDLYGAVIQGVDIFKPKVGKQGELISVGALVIFTDGTDRAGRKSKDEALNKVNGTGVSVYTIGLRGESNNPSELDELTLIQLGKNGSLFSDGIENLAPCFVKIANEIKADIESRYLLEYCSPRRKGKHQLKIQVLSGDGNQKKLYGSLTVEYTADNFTGGCKIYNPCSP